MFDDLRFAVKLLWKQKAFSAAALATLALCIGANTAIFTVLNAVVLRGLPYPNPDRLVTMYNIYPGVGVTDRGANGVPDYLDRRKLTEVFSEVSLVGNSGYDVGLGGSPQRVNGQYVTPSFFRVLGIQPALGRTFTAEEAVLGKEKVAILSEGLWKDLFAGDPHVLGKDIRLSGVQYRIVGVMPSGFGLDTDVRLWVPFAFTPRQTSDDARHSNNWGMIARLQPGVSIGRARQRIDALNRENLERFPKYRELLENARFGTRVAGLKDELVRDVRPTLWLLQAAVGFVLLIGCVNLANLMLVRANVRMKELAIRFSLGAGRLRIGKQLLTEAVVLAVLGGALGVGVAAAGIRVLSNLGARDLPRGSSIDLDWRVLVFTAVTAVVTGLIFGCVPLVQLLRRDLNAIFRNDQRTGTMSRHAIWVRSALVVSQVSLAFVLLIGSGLLTLSFTRLLRVNPGFQPDNVMTARFSLPEVRYGKDPAARTFISRVLDRLRSLPGVREAGATTYLPFAGDNNASVIRIEGRALAPGETPPVPGWNTVDGGYFAAMHIPLLQGRVFRDSDGPEAQKVAIIDEFLARKYWPNGGAVGAQLRRGMEADDAVCTIVGVVGSVKTGALAENNPVGQVYYDYQQFVPRAMHIVLRTRDDSAEVISAVRREIAQADPELPMFDVKTMPERISASVTNQRVAMVLCLIFGGLALLLAAVGIYGVLAYSVSQRTREFGIRSALGADTTDLLGMILGQGVRLAAIGLGIGAAGAFALTRLIGAMLYNVEPNNAAVYAAVALVLGVVAALASLIPSVRAIRVQPSVALRYE